MPQAAVLRDPTSAEAQEVVVLREPAHLARYIPEWEDLAAHALEPNVYYEHWMLLPALQAFAADADLWFVLTFERARRGAPAPLRLTGLFPLQRRRHYRRVPVPALTLWRHPHCHLCTPLVRAGRARQSLDALLGWLAAEAPATLVEWTWIAGEGPFQQALALALAEADRPVFEAERHARGVLRPRASAQEYLAEALPGSSRRELQRLERRLAERGSLRYEDCPGPSDATAAWLEAFLALEAAGWKGRRGTALGSSGESRAFFLGAAAQAARRDRLMLLGLYAAGRPVALKCNLLAPGGGSFAFKIAYDEEFRRYSPGTLLELENIRRFHEKPALGWMDSCAEPADLTLHRLWLDQCSVVTQVSATGRALGGPTVSALLRRLLRKA